MQGHTHITAHQHVLSNSSECTHLHTHTPAHTVSSRLAVLGMQTVSQEQGRALSGLIQPNVSWHISPFLGLSILTHRDPLYQVYHLTTHTHTLLLASIHANTHTCTSLYAQSTNAQMVVIHKCISAQSIGKAHLPQMEKHSRTN